MKKHRIKILGEIVDYKGRKQWFPTLGHDLYTQIYHRFGLENVVPGGDYSGVEDGNGRIFTVFTSPRPLPTVEGFIRSFPRGMGSRAWRALCYERQRPSLLTDIALLHRAKVVNMAGKKTLATVQAALDKYGLKLGMSPEEVEEWQKRRKRS